MDTAIHAAGLCKHFGDTSALADFDLEVRAGTVCGLLGPNGAGKTTAVRILTTLLRADGGVATVAGADVATAAHEVRRRIGLSGQAPAIDEILSGRQNLVLFARLNRLSRAAAGRRAEELLEMMDLTHAADRAVKHYSGGMRRRLDLAVTLILAPDVLFLDEPTTGLDPRNRNDVWAAIRDLVAGGTTVLLTTQYLDEADQLADQIVVIDSGRVIANGPPAELKQQVGTDRIELVVDPSRSIDAERIVEQIALGPPTTDVIRGSVGAAVADRVEALAELLPALAAEGIDVRDLELRRPTLDDVFLRLTGRTTASETAEAPVPNGRSGHDALEVA